MRRLLAFEKKIEVVVRGAVSNLSGLDSAGNGSGAGCSRGLWALCSEQHCRRTLVVGAADGAHGGRRISGMISESA